MKTSKTPEILSPAGSLEKLKFAVHYGADSVYLGGEAFNLRSRAGNFTEAELEEASEFCRQRGVKTVFLMNAFLHEDDLDMVRTYISSVKKFRFDAVMVSDPGMLYMLRDEGIESEIHLSTQMNTLNHLAVRFWQEAGFSRIVLARETTLDEIKKIREHTDIELEAFIHGALCVAYSGRCLLSRYMTGRDANQGDCVQPCRWNYALVEVKRPGNYLDIREHARGTEILSSKDLCLIEHLDEYTSAGVDVFKIEGRIKSIYHAANTTRIYRDARDSIGTDRFKADMPFRLSELDLVSHRPYTDNLFNEFNGMEFTGIPYVNKTLFMGCKTGTGLDKREAEIKVFNPIRPGDTMDAIFPIHSGVVRDRAFSVLKITDSEGEDVSIAIPGKTYNIKFDADMDDHAILRQRTDSDR